mmetsp:Transcript_1529/g.3293  ORF Transcript_1529/g.3293 Transcript_1529/m.3293 type:complete len:154 (-) Transcript_1529:92-553(-)
MFLARCIDWNFQSMEVPFTRKNVFGSGQETLLQKVYKFMAEMQATWIDGEPEASDLMHKLLVHPDKRLDVFGIMQHEFFHPLRLPFHDVEGVRVWGDDDLLNIPPPWQPPVDGPNDVSMQGASEDEGVEPFPDAMPCGAAKLDVAGYTMVARR